MTEKKAESSRSLLATLEEGWESTPGPPVALRPSNSEPDIDRLDAAWADEGDEDDFDDDAPLPDQRLEPEAYAAAKKAREERAEFRKRKRRLREETKRTKQRARAQAAESRQKKKQKRGSATASRPPKVEDATRAPREQNETIEDARSSEKKSRRARPRGLWLLAIVVVIFLAAIALALSLR